MSGKTGSRWRRIVKPLASIRLAVFVIIGIAIVSAYGTIVESQFDARTAQKLVYHSWWSYSIFGLLAINLIAVMFDRWPWKAHHTGFVLAHVGIVTLLAGSIITRYYGIDGSMRFGIGETKKEIMLPDEELIVWASYDGSQYTVIQPPLPVDFMVNPPSEKNPIRLPAGSDDIEVIGYNPYTLRDVRIEESNEKAAGPAVRFQLQNDRVNVSEWLIIETRGNDDAMDLGPAQVILSSREDFIPPMGNYILLKPLDGERLEYRVQTESRGDSPKTGIIRAGENLETGWMGLQFRLLKFIPNAQYQVRYEAVQRPGPTTTSAIRVRFLGQEYDLGLNTSKKFFSSNAVYIVSYGNRRVPIDFPIKLHHFEIGRYQGTIRAASYESIVEVPDKEGIEAADVSASVTETEVGEGAAMPAAHAKQMGAPRPGYRRVRIAMNEPLKYDGLTFYQASFEEDETGQPAASILSVNYDPGRPWKYLGSLMIVLGTIHMFYFRPRQIRKAAQKRKEKSQGIRAASL